MSDPTDSVTKHRCRHDDQAMGMGGTHPNRVVVASACARLIPIGQSVTDPSEADCSECTLIASMMESDDYKGLFSANPISDERSEEPK